MPEGHTIHRLAKDLDAGLGRAQVSVSSPQGRFSGGAALINDATLDKAEAWGKHLFCWWDNGHVLHVHLGLIGKFRLAPIGTVPGDTVRLRLAGAMSAWHLTGPQTCAVITPSERDEVVDRLGPDPLRRGSKRRSEFVTRLTSTRRPIGAAILDQGIIAGIGNVYRAELLFLLGIHPETPANSIDEETAGRLWDCTVSQLRRGLKWGRIVTVSNDDVQSRVTRRIDNDDALYAYHRGDMPCRRCGAPIERTEVGGRSIWFCPECQPS